MQQLKEATRSQHEELESAVDVMRESVTLEDYGMLLLKFHRFYKPTESGLSRLDWPEVGYDFEGRKKLPKLESDLAHLGLLETAVADPRPFAAAPTPDGFASGFGTLYVLEGATLGGQIISRHLRSVLDIEAGRGGSFFGGYGELTGPMWKEFCGTVSSYVDRFGGEDQMIESARQTFDAFRVCFTRSEARSV